MTRRDAALVGRARLHLVGLFALAGIALASWLARIPTVRDLLGIGTAEIGLLLLVGAVGSLLTVTVAGALVQRYGSRRVLLAATVVLAAALVLLGVGPTLRSPVLLATGVLLNGVAVALGNVTINVESARVERALGRTVIPQFHAAFSVGAVLGSATTALSSATGVPIGVQLPLTAVVVVVWRLASLRGAVLPATDDERPERAADPRSAGRGRRLGTALEVWREPRTLLVGVVVMAAALSEGAANSWLALAVVDGFDRTEAVGGTVLALFVTSMTVVRLLGTRLVDRFGRVAVLRASGVSSIVGLLLLGFTPTLALASVGVVLWGAGAALAVPLGMAAASDDPVRAASRVAVVSAFASVAQLVAPPLLGLAAQSLGARHALVLVTVALLASVVVAPAARREGPRTLTDTPSADAVLRVDVPPSVDAAPTPLPDARPAPDGGAR